MEPQIGAKVIDISGKPLGNIDYVVRDTWSGELRKLILYRKPPDKDLILTLEDISEVTEDAIKLNVSFEELSER